MFIGREKELSTLNDLFTSDKFEFVVVYATRRVEKTTLINKYIEDKDDIYYLGMNISAKKNLEYLNDCIMEYLDSDYNSFTSFQDALEYVFKLSKKERIIYAIDECRYVTRSSKSLASTIQLLIDKYKDSSKLMLILCESSMSYIEDHILAYKAPLHGRRTAQIKHFLLTSKKLAITLII